MYLEHFGLNEPPFRITPVTEFFFSGANRGEILDALIYSICEVEGIVKVSGEVGSGKTMLCRMLLEKLPGHIETIYLANPSLSREEMLYAIADGLGLNIKGERVGIIMQNIQNKLEEKAREGKRVAVLVDEAHAMPPDTLEELRLLYNLQVGNAKLLQLILFGQPELNAKLDQPNMRQLKDRIVHHFNMQPLSRNILENYLMFRMRAANYRGPNIFSLDSIKLIAKASNGLMRRVNVLADKSLLAAFVEDTHNIEARHVQAAMRDSELKPERSLLANKLLIGGAVIALVAIGLAAWWVLDNPQTPIRQATSTSSGGLGQPQDSPPVQPTAPPKPMTESQPDSHQPITAQSGNTLAPATAAADQAAASPIAPAKDSPKTDNPPPAPGQAMPGTPAAVTPAKQTNKSTQELPRPESTRDPFPPDASKKLPATQTAPKPPAERAKNAPSAETNKTSATAASILTPKPEPVADNLETNIPLAETEKSELSPNKPSLFVQRLEAGKQLLDQKKAVASIQLYYNEQINVGRIENFLVGAERLGKLSEIYLLPAKFGNKDGLRVLYGTYPTVDAARNAIPYLPKRYQDAFATSIHIF